MTDTHIMDIQVNEKVTNFFTKYKKQQFKKGEILIRADEDPQGIFYLADGIVRSYYISKKGDEITLNMFKPHTFFPMSWVVSDIHNQRYFEAMTACITYKVPKEKVLAFIKKEPDVVLDLLRRVYIGIEGLWMHIEYLSSGNALEKLISTLLILGKRFGREEGGRTTIQLKLTEKELGEYSGMYRETVSREMQLLKEKGLVVFSKGTITIPDLKKLENALPL